MLDRRIVDIDHDFNCLRARQEYGELRLGLFVVLLHGEIQNFENFHNHIALLAIQNLLQKLLDN